VRFSIDAAGIAHTVPSHPTQAYASLASILIFFALLALRTRLSVPGTLFFTYLIMYSVARALVEILRAGYTAERLIGPLTEAQVASMAVIALSAFGIWLLRRHARRTPKGVDS
jgi:prolipoprotein diacylglyceryltransferase